MAKRGKDRAPNMANVERRQQRLRREYAERPGVVGFDAWHKRALERKKDPEKVLAERRKEAARAFLDRSA